jgi:spore maturation protein CgeB
MKFVVFGLTISSSWGNGHATLWRGLIRALARQGHRIVFFERDLPYYADNRDLFELPRGRLVLYEDWEAVRGVVTCEVADADVAIVTSYCPDAIAAGELLLESRAIRLFYDLDTPVTLARLAGGEPVPYIGPRGLLDYDLVLSYTGGAALDLLQHRLGARAVAPLYGHVDPDVHRPVAPLPHYRADFSYLGTYSADRQKALQALFIEPARLRSDRRFVLGGAQYPQEFSWHSNIFFVRHLPPDEHPAFFSSSRLTLNVTRRPMAEMGWCPSGRLFEAAACGTAVLTDRWEGIETFFCPEREILTADDTGDVLAALYRDDAEIRRIGGAARERVLAEHTSERRVEQLIDALRLARAPLDAAVGA